MKNCKVPDDDVSTLFGEETTSAETDNGSVHLLRSTTETTETENASMPKPTSSETIGTGDGSAVSTTEANLSGDASELQQWALFLFTRRY